MYFVRPSNNHELTVLFVAGLVLACTACASTNDVLGAQVDEVFHLPTASDAVVACFASKNHMRLIERPDGAKVAIIRNGYGGVVRTFSIYPEGTGSRVEVRHEGINVPGYVWKQCVGLK